MDARKFNDCTPPPHVLATQLAPSGQNVHEQKVFVQKCLSVCLYVSVAPAHQRGGLTAASQLPRIRYRTSGPRRDLFRLALLLCPQGRISRYNLFNG